MGGAEVVAGGLVSGALSLDGEGAFVEVPDSPTLTTPSRLTLDAWVHPADLTTDGAIVSKYNSSPGVGQISWYLGQFEQGRLRLTVCENPSLPENCTGVDTNEPVLTAGCWHLVVATFDVDATKKANIYVDGEIVPSSPNLTGTVRSITDSDVPVHVGTFTPIGGEKANFWNGLIDELEIYDRALSQSEIDVIYNAGTLGKCKD